jgi:hypothetical protein
MSLFPEIDLAARMEMGLHDNSESTLSTISSALHKRRGWDIMRELYGVNVLAEGIDNQANIHDREADDTHSYELDDIV